jgi:glycine betaine/choline ABC-type transport system substrate-binding protein
MGALTEHLTQLRKEILALRSARQGLTQALEREAEERRVGVSQTLADFSKNFASMARKTKANRLDSLADLKRTVNGLRTAVHTDLSSIRQAWRALRRNSKVQRNRKRKPTWREAVAKQAAKPSS